MIDSELQEYKLGKSIKRKIISAQSHLLAHPVPIIKLAKSLGISAVEKHDLDKNVSGRICLTEDKYVIHTNKAESKARRRFTIAHELAHFLLHRDKIGNGITENTLYRSGLSTRDEIDANRLAAVILMPNEKIEEYIDKYGKSHVTIAGLSNTFGVSVSAMTVRLGIPSVMNVL